MFLCVWVEFCRLLPWPLRCFVWPAPGSLKFEYGVLASLHSPVYQISHHSLLSLAQPVHPLALTLYPLRHLDLRPLPHWNCLWYVTKITSNESTSFFFFFFLFLHQIGSFTCQVATCRYVLYIKPRME